MQNLAMLQQMLPIQQAPTATLPQAGFVGYEISPGNTRSLVGNLPPSQVIGPPMGNPSGVAPTYTIFQPSDLTALNHQLVQYYPIPTPPPTQVTAMVPTTASIRADRLEVCRDYQRGNCTRGEFECRYAHPPDLSMVDPGENTVIVCMDCIKGRCIRDKCKYFHPPMHLQAKIRATQNPTSPFLPSMPSPSVSSPQPSVMMSNPTPMPHSPLKRHNIEPQMIPSAGNPIGNPTALTQTSSNSPNPVTLTAMYGYNGITYPGLTNAHHQALSTVPAYYQHAMPIHLPYGVVTNAIHPGQINPLGVFNMPTTSKSDGNVMLK